MDKKDFIRKVKALNLPSGEYVVFGGGPFVVHGIRETRDIDLFVTSRLYEALRAKGWKEEDWDLIEGQFLSHGICQADDTWNYGTYNPTPEELIERADMIDGVPFAPLVDVLRWKEEFWKAFGRPKDLADIELIRGYMESLKP